MMIEEYQPASNKISRLSKLPLQQQIYEILREKIAKGFWQAGDMLPTEMELMKEFQISRATIRPVMDRLTNEGLLFRQRGRGTFVSEPTLEQGLSRIISFTEDMRRRGLEPETKILAQKLLPATEVVATALKIQPGEEVAYLKRLRLANNEPMCIEESYLIHRLCPGVFEDDFSKIPLRETLEKKYRLRIMRALQKIHAIVATPGVAKLLRIPNPSAILFIERVSYNEWDAPVELLHLFFRGDRYSLYNELRD